jgi:hypothetical protein
MFDAPPRIRRLHAALIKTIPRVPNDRASLLHMRQKALGDLLIDYTNWCARYVGIRPRTVSVEPAASMDARWNANAALIASLLAKVRRGDDLLLHLSSEPRTRGYAVAAGTQGATTPKHKWLDNDGISPFPPGPRRPGQQISAVERAADRRSRTVPKVEWGFLHLDLVIVDKAKPALIGLRRGWN